MTIPPDRLQTILDRIIAGIVAGVVSGVIVTSFGFFLYHLFN